MMKRYLNVKNVRRKYVRGRGRYLKPRSGRGLYLNPYRGKGFSQKKNDKRMRITRKKYINKKR